MTMKIRLFLMLVTLCVVAILGQQAFAAVYACSDCSNGSGWSDPGTPTYPACENTVSSRTLGDCQSQGGPGDCVEDDFVVSYETIFSSEPGQDQEDRCDLDYENNIAIGMSEEDAQEIWEECMAEESCWLLGTDDDYGEGCEP